MGIVKIALQSSKFTILTYKDWIKYLDLEANSYA